MFERLKCLLLLIAIQVIPTEQQKPNILLIVTDDQDVELNGMFPMHRTQKLLAAAGVSFKNSFTSSPLCCPSRASILAGQYAHNHHTINNSISGGCYSRHFREEIEPNALPVILRELGGYDTFFAGKYLNEYKGDEVPHGWTDFHGLHGNSQYYNYTLRENERNVSYTDTEDAYLTDVLRDLTMDFLASRSKTGGPFFAMIAPPAPHAPYTPAERHRNAFAGVKALRTPNFNQLPTFSEKHWLLTAADNITDQTLARMDLYFQLRWESLLAVDELVASLILRLEQQGQLQNTYVIYTSDNGYHIGQFAQPFDKRQPYETDIRVPLLIRGPGIPSGVEINAPALLIDLMPTILEWANLPIPHGCDGVSLHNYLVHAKEYDTLTDHDFHRGLLIEHWGEGNDATYNDECPWSRADHLAECTAEADCHCQDVWNNTYACIRHFRYKVNRLYCEFNDFENFVEAYELDVDPYEMKNLGYEWLPIERALYSLALSNLTHCSGSTCANVNV